LDEPLHNLASHAADAFRILSTGINLIKGKRSIEETERSNLNQMGDSSGCLPVSYLYTPTARINVSKK